MSIAEDIVNNLKGIAVGMNEKGIPFPLLRDNNTGKGSLTLTMFVVSFSMAVLLLLGKVTKVLGDVDYNNVLWLLGITGGFYTGKKFSGNGKAITLDTATIPTEEKK